MGPMASQITSPAIAYSAVYAGADKRTHESSASLALVRGIHRGPMNSPHKWPVTRKMFPFDDVIMVSLYQEPIKIFPSAYTPMYSNSVCLDNTGSGATLAIHDSINSLAPGRFEGDFLISSFQFNFNNWLIICCKFALTWLSLDLADDKTTLVQVLAWWINKIKENSYTVQATSHYLSQCWSQFLVAIWRH